MRRNLIKDSDGIVSRYVNREISTRISVALYRNGIFINPNILTVVVFIIGIFSFIAIYLNMYILGGVLALLSSILMALMARLPGCLTGKQSLGRF